MDTMKLIRTRRQNVEIEHENRRVIIPRSDYDDYTNGKVDSDYLLTVGIPVSIEWADYLEGVYLDGDKIMNALHQHGIHTTDDLMNNPARFTGAIMSALGITGSGLAKRVKGEN